MRRELHLFAVLLGIGLLPLASTAAQTQGAATPHGALPNERNWWDVTFYDLHLTIDPADSTIRGWNSVTYRVVGSPRALRIDLRTPMSVDSVVQDGRQLPYRRDGNAVFVTPVQQQPKGALRTLTVYYHGAPEIAAHPPWDGGAVWARDPDGRPWFATTSPASIWWPNKDTRTDEPDSQRVVVTVPDSLQAIANGRLRGVQHSPAGQATYDWFVANPINNYNVAVYVGRYTQLDDTYDGEDGRLTLTYWPLVGNVEAARSQFQQVKPMLACFERWFGPYPWYRDGYQLVEAPFLGNEHQSALAYGNGYVNGYKGRDLSGTGFGDWDYIIVHESGHEWFGNNISSMDMSGGWLHEGFTTYSEAVFAECKHGAAAGAAYVIGLRKRIANDEPITEGSSDEYSKGANMLHTIRQVIGNDSTWRAILRGLNTTFRHQLVSGQQVQTYISARARRDLSKVFAQYLTTTKIPVFEYRLEGSTLKYRWANVVPGFDMPFRVQVGPDRSLTLRPGEKWQTATLPLARAEDFKVDQNFYVIARPIP